MLAWGWGMAMGGTKARNRHASCKLKALEFKPRPISLSWGTLVADPRLGGSWVNHVSSLRYP